MARTVVDLNRWLKASLKIELLDPVVQRLMDRAARVKRDVRASAIVGYQTSYALYVHEDLSMNHPRGGQAKFLTTPVYRNLNEIHKEVVNFLKSRKSATLPEALVSGCKFILGRSLPLVPIDTGALKMSGFVTLEANPPT